MAGVHSELGEDPPVLQGGEAVLARCSFVADKPVRLLLCGGQTSPQPWGKSPDEDSNIWQIDGCMT